MKVIFSAALAAGLLFAGQAFADNIMDTQPLILSAAEMDNVTAGVGANNAAVAPWGALGGNGFSLNHNSNADPGAAKSGSLDGVAVPSAVPNSFCIALC